MYQPSDHGESIYNIVPPKVEEMPKPPMYRSKIPSLPPTASTFHAPGTSCPQLSNMAGDAAQSPVRNKSHSNFGKAPGSYKNDPTTFMKKMAKSSSVPSLREVRQSNPDSLRPSHLKESRFAGGGGPPKRGEEPVMNLVTNKNFIVANAVEVILAQPKKLQTTQATAKNENFGKTPKYLHRVKKDIENEYDYISQLQEQAAAEYAPQISALCEEERLDMIEQLKAKWEKANTDYQAATHCTLLDTEGKVRRKEKCEAELSQLEKDIERLSKGNIQIDHMR